MTISSENRKSGPFLGTGAVSEYPFDFAVFSADDLLVVVADTLGAESTLVLNSDYTVDLNSDQDSNPGGTVVLTDPLPDDYLLVATSKLASLQPTDLTNQGGFYPQVVTRALDRLTIFVQQLKEQIVRSVKVPITDTRSPEALVIDLFAAGDVATEKAAAAEAAAAASIAAAAVSEASAAAAIDDLLVSENTWIGGNKFREPVILEKDSVTGLELGIRCYGGAAPVVHGYLANGTQAAPTAVNNGQMLLGIGSRAWDGADFAEHSTAAMHMVATEDHTPTAQGTDFRVVVTPNGLTHAGRITAVRYYSGSLGPRAEMRLHGTEAERMRFQTDVAGQNSSLTVVPNGDALASNVQARDSNGAVAHRAYLESNTSLGTRLVSDTIGGGTAHPITVEVGATVAQTVVEAGTITHHFGTKLGSDAPILRVKKITGTSPATEGGTVSVAHGLDASLIRGLHVIVRPTGAPTEGTPPGFTAIAGRQYNAYFGGTNVALINHATNSENVLSAPFTALITYEPAA